MSKEAIFQKDGLEEVVYANTAAVSAGEVINIPGIGVGVAVTDIAAATEGVYAVKGVVQVNMTTGYLVTQGDKVYWDVSTSKAITSALAVAGDPYIGRADNNVTALGGYVNVRLGDTNADIRTEGGLSASDIVAFSGDHTCVNATLATNNHLETVTNARFLSTDRSFCNMISTLDNANRLIRSKVNDGTLTIVMSTVNTGGVINYNVQRAVAS